MNIKKLTVSNKVLEVSSISSHTGMQRREGISMHHIPDLVVTGLK